jgi:hypothetical protein
LAPIVNETIGTVYAMIEKACRAGAVSPCSQDFCEATGLSHTNRLHRDAIWVGVQQMKTAGRIDQTGIGSQVVFEIAGVGKTTMRARIGAMSADERKAMTRSADLAYQRKMRVIRQEQRQLSLEVGAEVIIPAGHLMSEQRWRKMVNASSENLARLLGRPLSMVGFRDEVRLKQTFCSHLPRSPYSYDGSLVGCAAAMVASSGGAREPVVLA